MRTCVNHPHPRRVISDASRFARVILVGATLGAPTVYVLTTYYAVSIDEAASAAAIPFGLMYILMRGASSAAAYHQRIRGPKQTTATPAVLEPFFFLVTFGVLSVAAALMVSVSQIAYQLLQLRWAMRAGPTWVLLLLGLAAAWVVLAVAYLLVLIAVKNRHKIAHEIRGAVSAFQSSFESRIAH